MDPIARRSALDRRTHERGPMNGSVEARHVMRIMVNGQSRELPAPTTVAGLLQTLGIHAKAVVVERNLRIVDRDRFDAEDLEEGDRIEIIRLVGGG